MQELWINPVCVTFIFFPLKDECVTNYFHPSRDLLEDLFLGFAMVTGDMFIQADCEI